MAGDPKTARARVRDYARRGIRAAQGALDEEAAQIGQEVYEAALELRRGAGDDPLPLAVRAPLFALGVRAVEVIRKQHPGVIESEEDAWAVIEYLTEGWCSMMLAFDRQHYAEWRARTEAGGSLGSPAH